MDVITHEHLRTLIDAGTAPCISIYMPTHKSGRETLQDRVRLKDLIREAETKLIEVEPRAENARRLLQPAKELNEQDEFWLHNEHGLAIFISEGYFKVYRVPIEVEATTSVNEKFYLKPLLPLLENKHFYVLALSQGAARLLECDQHTCDEIQLPEDVALSVDEAAGWDKQEPLGTVRHAGSPTNPGSLAGAYHGQAQEIQTKEHEDMLFYFRQLDEGIRRVIKNPNAPLVVAGPSSTAPFYKDASQCPNLYPEIVSGNFEHISNEELTQRARELLEKKWHEELNRLQERYGTAKAQGIASDNVEEIVQAATAGRVDVLFVPTGIPRWSNDNDGDLDHSLESGFDHDQIEEAAIQTLRTSGRIVAVLPDQLPNNGELAAIYRY